MVGEPDEEVDPKDLLLVQIGGASVVAILAMLAVLFAPTSFELLAARLTIAGAIAAQVFLEVVRATHLLEPRYTGFSHSWSEYRGIGQVSPLALSKHVTDDVQPVVDHPDVRACSGLLPRPRTRATPTSPVFNVTPPVVQTRRRPADGPKVPE
jgi:hypothetical protein